jgi:hypothetical protein
MDRTAIRFARWSWIAGIAALAPTTARAQTPVDPADAPPVCNRRGRLHRMFHHTAHTVQDKLVGYPDNFVEPPLGHYVNEQLAIQVRKADPHRYTLYRSDFLPGTSSFSPIGASRYNIMATRMPGWLGPITIEWTPEQPALAEARRQAIVKTLLDAGQPVLAERVVIAPSPYPGAIGFEPANNYSNALSRAQMSAQGFGLPPAETAAMGVR